MAEFNKPDFSNSNVDYSLPRISISKILGTLEEPFDRDGVAKKTKNKYFEDPESQYYHKEVFEIIEMWEKKGKESCKYGSLLDDYIGVNLTKTDADVKLFKLENRYDQDSRFRELCESFDNFYSVLSKSGDTVFVDREKSVYHKVNFVDPEDSSKEVTYYIKGRFDALFYNKRTNKWIVIDWKSSGSIDKVPNKWTKKLFAPMDKFPALNWYTYTTQLYFYKKTLVEDGYLPAGTIVDDVVVMIVNLPGKKIEELGTNFGTHGPAYQYDTILLDTLFEQSVINDYLLNKKTDSQIKEEIQKEQEELLNMF